jgi:molybdopterin biosynthesis enzyme
VHASFSSQGLQVTPVPWNGSSDLRATIDANAMALLRPETGLYSAGQQVATYFWSGMIPLHSDD